MSFTKILLLLALAVGIYLLWRGFKAHKRAASPPPLENAAPDSRSANAVEDLTACPACGAYMAVNSPACGRADCPRKK
ncbi:MAG: hypothetical protein FJX46_10800 [Alphaproteobacteria bacterium]|nr:hypothetical protein [Alphaproteobacteria bacterium]